MTQYIIRNRDKKKYLITCLHEHKGKNQLHDQYHVDNPTHTSTKELEQEYQVYNL